MRSHHGIQEEHCFSESQSEKDRLYHISDLFGVTEQHGQSPGQALTNHLKRLLQHSETRADTQPVCLQERISRSAVKQKQDS